MTTNKEMVNHPSHYKKGGLEAIDVIEAWDLGFCLGNTVKYVARAGEKFPDKEIEDLNKAKWYLERRIWELEQAKEKEAAALKEQAKKMLDTATPSKDLWGQNELKDSE